MNWVSAITGGISAYGAIQSGQMTSQSLNAQADYALQNAAEAEAQGAFDANRQSLVSASKIGTQQAALGASGVSSGYGSGANILAASASNAEMDRLNILHGADIKAINYQNQAALDRYGGASAVQGSYWKAAGDLTGGLINSQTPAATPGGTPTLGADGNPAAATSTFNSIGAS
jgi:hypothetical protein